MRGIDGVAIRLGLSLVWGCGMVLGAGCSSGSGSPGAVDASPDRESDASGSADGEDSREDTVEDATGPDPGSDLGSDLGSDPGSDPGIDPGALDSGGPEGVGEDATGEDASPDVADAEVGPAPWIHEALACGKPGSAGGVAAGQALTKVPVDLGAYPEAVCNDGSGAVFYARAASDAELADRWLIRLQGGGGCTEGGPCADRWCSAGTNFGMDKMTTRGTPDAIRSPGVHSRMDRNPWAGWNHVFVYYCSSDMWSGAGGVVEVVAGDGTPFRIAFHGAHIVDAVLSTLRDGVSYTSPAGAAVTMPALDDATLVVFAGASAGAAGVAWHLDRVAASLPGVEVLGLHDSNFAPKFEELDLAGTPMCTQDGVCDYETFQRNYMTVTGEGLWGSRLETSCEAAHPGDAWRCLDLGHVVRNHITTPVFVRMDLRDSQIGGGYIERGFAHPDHGPLTEASFAQLVREQLEGLRDLATTAEEGGAITRAPGTMAPACGKHEALGNDAAVFDTYVETADSPATMHWLFDNWRRGVLPSSGAASGAGQGCP